MKSVNEIKALDDPEKVVMDAESQAKIVEAAMRGTSVIVVTCDRTNYSASRIARAVEDCDVHILSLAMTPDSVGYDTITVELRVDTPSATNVVRSIERYGYEVTYVDTPVAGNDPIDDAARLRALEALRLIEV